MGKRIEAAVKEIDPKNLDELQAKIADAVKEGIDPEAMKTMAKDLQIAIEKGFGKAKDEKSSDKPDKPGPTRGRVVVREQRVHTDTADTKALERRLGDLEKKLDRLLDQLDKPEQ
jgi:hypothetical protein